MPWTPPPRSSGAALAAALLLTLAGPPQAAALGQDDYTGRVGLVSGSYCPQGTLEADGRLLQITNFSALYSLLGVTYGGDGKHTFALPDLRKKVPATDLLYCIVVNGLYPQPN